MIHKVSTKLLRVSRAELWKMRRSCTSVVLRGADRQHWSVISSTRSESHSLAKGCHIPVMETLHWAPCAGSFWSPWRLRRSELRVPPMQKMLFFLAELVASHIVSSEHVPGVRHDCTSMSFRNSWCHCRNTKQSDGRSWSTKTALRPINVAETPLSNSFLKRLIETNLFGTECFYKVILTGKILQRVKRFLQQEQFLFIF